MKMNSIVLAAALFGLSGGCAIQFPTEKHSVADLRPAITFKTEARDPATLDARVTVDGLDAGRLGDFIEGQGALRVLSGNHVVQVIKGGAAVLNERVYLGDGVTRAFLIG